ncbi:MAG: hypothetical protein R3E31_11420 [Chloroflexota bacterium]
MLDRCNATPTAIRQRQTFNVCNLLWNRRIQFLLQASITKFNSRSARAVTALGSSRSATA